MRVLYIDCFSGISGDMCLAALLDLGLPVGVLQKTAEQLGLPLSIKTKTVRKQGLRALRVLIEGLAPQPPHRSYADLLKVLADSRLPETIEEKVRAALNKLASAEAAAHGCEPEEVHFHELGGLDTLIDLAGVFQGIADLGIDRITISPPPLGRGQVKTAHGLIPLPAPATLHLLRGIPTRGVDLASELVTPTGAVLAAILGDSYGPPPGAIWEKFGYGAGCSDLPSQPNILRMLLGQSHEDTSPNRTADSVSQWRAVGQTQDRQGGSEESVNRGQGNTRPMIFPASTIKPPSDDGLADSYDLDSVMVIETQIDDSNPELLPYLRERLEEEGALDVTFTPTVMKKGRPGIVLTVLADNQLLSRIAETIFKECSAIGLRWYQAGRIKLYRQSSLVTTPFGEVPVKVGYRLRKDGEREVLNIAPEYEDCARCAARDHLPVKEVYQAVLAAARRWLKSEKTSL